MYRTEELQPGQIVIAKNGRDKGRALVVLSTDNEGYCLVVDGKRRTLDLPKRKKIKDFQKTRKHLNPEQMSTNKKIRTFLNKLKTYEEEE